MTERIGVFGASGLVGEPLTERLRLEGYHILSPGHSEVDITDEAQVLRWFQEMHPSGIILLAAYTNMDGAQKNPTEAFKQNCLGPYLVAKIAKVYNAHLIFFSTNFVFNGELGHGSKYLETDTLPLLGDGSRGIYAETKHQGEARILQMNPASAVVRIAYPYGNIKNPRDYARKMIAAIVKDYPIYVDQYISPSSTNDIARAVEQIVRRRLRGILHVASPNITTPYKFAEKINEKLLIRPELRIGIFENTPGKAPRPRNGTLSVTNSEKILGIKFKKWQDELDLHLELLLQFIPREELFRG